MGIKETKDKKRKVIIMDIRAHRFVPRISTTSKVMVDKKRKNMSRRKLNVELRKKGYYYED